MAGGLHRRGARTYPRGRPRQADLTRGPGTVNSHGMPILAQAVLANLASWRFMLECAPYVRSPAAERRGAGFGPFHGVAASRIGLPDARVDAFKSGPQGRRLQFENYRRIVDADARIEEQPGLACVVQKVVPPFASGRFVQRDAPRQHGL